MLQSVPQDNQNTTAPPADTGSQPDAGNVDDWKTAKCLSGTRVRYGVRQYKVLWENDDPPSWEPIENLTPALLHAYHIKYTKMGTRRRRPLLEHHKD